MKERQQGCICELHPESGEPLVIDYGECPVHKPEAIDPKTTAKTFYDDYKRILHIENDMRPSANPFAKECAVRMVDEILSVLESFNHHEYGKVLIPFYQKVKEEIINNQ